MTADQIARQLRSHGTPVVVLSGGEPLMHQTSPVLHELFALMGGRVQWHVETNGTMKPTPALLDAVTHFTVSPKLEQGDLERRRLRPKPLEDWAVVARHGRAIWKVVCRNADDVGAAYHLFSQYGVPESARWVMPEGTTADRVLKVSRRIAPSAAELGLNLTLRSHTLMYGQERAR
jgi:organic radical activating enzyme